MGSESGEEREPAKIERKKKKKNSETRVNAGLHAAAYWVILRGTVSPTKSGRFLQDFPVWVPTRRGDCGSIARMPKVTTWSLVLSEA